MLKNKRLLVQLVFLTIFIAVTALGKVQLWMGVFLAGILLALWKGRIYCGWICPIHTGIKAINVLKKKLKLQNRKSPTLLSQPWTSWVGLSIFISIFLWSKVAQVKLPVLPLLFLLGLLITLMYSENLWHRWLCPYGVILSLPTRFSRHGMSIEANNCTNCKLCVKHCPGDAIVKASDQHVILRNVCLSCGICEGRCNRKTIHFK